MQLLEFCTGLHASTALRGHLRWWPGLHQARDAGAAKLGDRSTGCLVQPDWRVSGVYRLEKSKVSGSVLLVHMNGASSDVPLSWLALAGASCSDFTIHYNWSKVKAQIFDQGGTPRGWCSQLLPTFSEPGSKKTKRGMKAVCWTEPAAPQSPPRTFPVNSPEREAGKASTSDIDAEGIRKAGTVAPCQQHHPHRHVLMAMTLMRTACHCLLSLHRESRAGIAGLTSFSGALCLSCWQH